jgi:hypothetical protein
VADGDDNKMDDGTDVLYRRMQQRGAKTRAEIMASNEIPLEREFIVAVDTRDVWVGDGVQPVSQLKPLPTGLSAYQVWLQEGNTGTSVDFLASLVGEPGTPGDNVPTDAAMANYLGTDSLSRGVADERYLPTTGTRPVGHNELVVNAADYGVSPDALPDDNTAGLAAALSIGQAFGVSGLVYVPEGEYRVSGVAVPERRRLVGDMAMMYLGAPQRGTRFVMDTSSSAVAVVTLGRGASLAFVGIVGVGLGNNPGHDGISLVGENSVEQVSITGCRTGIEGNYTGANLLHRCFINSNARDGVRNIVDSHLSHCYMNANGGIGLNLQAGANDNVALSCKAEWNGGEGVLLFQTENNIVIGFVADRNGRAGIQVAGSSKWTVTGNVMRRNGRSSQGVIGSDVNLHLEANPSGLAFGNLTQVGADDDTTGYTSPATAAYLQGNQSGVVIFGNDFLGGVTAPAVKVSDSAQMWGNAGVSNADMTGIRANIGTQYASVPANGTASIQFPLVPQGNYSIGDAYEVAIVTRDPASGARAMVTYTALVARDGAGASVTLSAPVVVIGTRVATLAGQASTDGSIITLKLSAATALATQVSLRKM